MLLSYAVYLLCILFLLWGGRFAWWAGEPGWWLAPDVSESMKFLIRN